MYEKFCRFRRGLFGLHYDFDRYKVEHVCLDAGDGVTSCLCTEEDCENAAISDCVFHLSGVAGPVPDLRLPNYTSVD